MPASIIPRQGLICGDCSVRQLSDEGMNTDLPSSGLILVPMVIILVLAQQTVIWTHIAFEVWVICPGRMHHDTLRSDSSACFVASIVGQNEFMEVHFVSPSFP